MTDFKRVRFAALNGFSGLMAALCGFAAVIVAYIYLGVFATTAHIAVTGKPWEWRWQGASASASGSTEWTTCTGEFQACTTQTRPVLGFDNAAPLVVGLGAATLPGVVLAYGLFQAGLCFIALARGRYLQRRTVSRLARFALAGLFFVIASPFAGHLGKMAATLTGKAIQLFSGDHLSATFFAVDTTVTGVQEILIPIYAITLTIIALVMVRAARIAEDHAQIV